jgi:hypothetical protein
VKTKTVEELLQWAFVHELPKGGGVDGLDNANSAWRMLQASSWGKITAFAELMAMVDVDRGGGNYLIEQGEPHPDALAIGQAVSDLAFCDVVIPQGWNALADWPDDDGLVMPAVARAVERYELRPVMRRRAGIVSLVVGTAILGREPMWQAEPSKVRMIQRGGKPAWFVTRRMTDEFGRKYEMEVDGFNVRSQRPARGAYRKFEFSDDPTGDVLSRLDWQIWVASLQSVGAAIADKLVAHRIARLDRSMTPWLGEDIGGVTLVPAREGQGSKKFAAAC